MIAVAALLLPVLGLLLYGMDRIEDRMTGKRPVPRHARRRHLRLIHSSTSQPRRRADRSSRHLDAA
ncbi:hypothetical protein QF037_009106 [Streptomyces canus]|uniref:hypothetical protein n=1 Tax=Streptomyces canus TaxID=58343 RepID=UPI0027824684|nr:hypothetical protein [Streptomyces canus]MDQ0604761.1 hypothetical protein [Streptomyces canus]